MQLFWATDLDFILSQYDLFCRRVQAAREEATEKETLVPTDMEHTTYTQNFDNELYDPEEVQSCFSFFFFIYLFFIN